MPLTERRPSDGISTWALIEGTNLRNLIPDLNEIESAEALLHLRPEEAIKYQSVFYDWMMFSGLGYAQPEYVEKMLKEEAETKEREV